MIKSMLFSCVLIALVNFSFAVFAEPSFEQFVDGNNVEHLRLRLRRSAASKTLFGGSLNTQNAGTASNPGSTGAGLGSGFMDKMSEFSGPNGLKKLNDILQMSVTQISEKMGGDKGEASIGKVMSFLQKPMSDMGLTNKTPAEVAQMLMDSVKEMPATKAMKNLINPTGDSNGSNGLAKLFSSDASQSNTAQG